MCPFGAADRKGGTSGEINELVSDNARKNSKKILVDMFEKAIASDLLIKNIAKLLGHGSLQMTMDLYCYVTEDTLFDAMKLMEKKCV